MAEPFYAYSKADEPPEQWHKLEDHLRQVVELSRSFAHEFEAGD